MKTAMQEFLDWVQIYCDNQPYLIPEEAKKKATELLEKEKEQIERAYKNPYRLARVHPGNNMSKDFENYWSETYLTP